MCTYTNYINIYLYILICSRVFVCFQIWAGFSLFFVLLSIATFCLSSHLDFRVPRNASISINKTWTYTEKNKYSKPHPAIGIIDLICIFYFTVEIIIRISSCPDRKKLFLLPLTWVDILSIVPYFVEIMIVYIKPDLELTWYVQMLSIIRLIRIFRIFRLTRHFSGLKILAHTIKASAKELLLLIMFLLITVLIFACLIYYAEIAFESPENDFSDIPVGFWWAVVTMTTLGYGDMYPRTGLGYLVGGLCAVTGVLVLALPVPVIVNNFALYYSHAQARSKLPKKQKKVLVNAPDALKTVTPAYTISMLPDPLALNGGAPHTGRRMSISVLGNTEDTEERRTSYPSEETGSSEDSGIKNDEGEYGK